MYLDEAGSRKDTVASIFFNELIRKNEQEEELGN
jgi:hypothetical protein